MMTEGSIARNEFATYYGSYIEMVYTICKGDFTKIDEITKWKTEKFLFLGEYLIRKKDIESL
jgi:hypothetical protein